MMERDKRQEILINQTQEQNTRNHNENRAREVLNEFYGNQKITLPVDVIGIAHRNHIDVYRARFEDNVLKDNVYGFIERQGNDIRIVVNAENAATRRRFTVAHELGHFFLHHDQNSDLKYLDLRSTRSTPEESQANQFAAELLMPEAQLREEYDKLMFPTVEALANKFYVSKLAMKYRLSNLGLSAF